MLTIQDLRKITARTGARDIRNVEIDVLLTYILQLFEEKGLTQDIAFKGGTMLRKMVFGPRGRLSTDLDFTRYSDIGVDDLTLKLVDALAEPYHDIQFKIDGGKDWYITDDSCAANPICVHADNAQGVKIKLQISIREIPILPVQRMPQLQQDYFGQLPFVPTDVPCIAFEEVIAEKIRAASERSKIRDLHDLSELTGMAINQDLVRKLAVIKLWNSQKVGLNYEQFVERIQGDADYDVSDLTALLRRDQRPNLETMKTRVIEGYRFLAHLSSDEADLVADTNGKLHSKAQNLIKALRGPSEFNKRIDGLTALSETVGIGLVLARRALIAIEEAEPQGIDWHSIATATVDECISEHGQEPIDVFKALLQHSPGVTTEKERKALEQYISDNAETLQALYQEAQSNGTADMSTSRNAI